MEKQGEQGMNFSDIDFSAISRMMNNMSDEEKASLNDMAQNMMNNMSNTEEQEEVDMYHFLQIDEEAYANVPGKVLDQIEAAVDFEDFYEETKDADFSGSALFYAKAVLTMLRTYVDPVYKETLSFEKNVNTTTLYDYVYPLMDETNIHALMDVGYRIDWISLRTTLQQLYVVLNRAEYDFVSYEDVQWIKEALFKNDFLLEMMLTN